MNDQFGFRATDLPEILKCIETTGSIKKAVIFGSRAKGNYKRGSDVDIAVWANDRDKILQLSGMLNEETSMPYRFDLLNYDTLTNADLKDHIDRVGVVIYSV